MKLIPNDSKQWKSSSINKKYLFNSGSKKSTFRVLNNTHHLTSYFKNEVLNTSNTKSQKRVYEGETAILKRKVLDLKCKLSRLQGERGRNTELKNRLAELQKQKYEEENRNRNEIDQLMRKLCNLKGQREEQKTKLLRLEMQKEIKDQDLKKMEELVNAKEEELEDLQEKRSCLNKNKNQLLGEKDSQEKEIYLIREECNTIDLNSAKLMRQLRDVESKKKKALTQTNRIQV